MKRKNIFYGLSLTALAGLALASCSNELELPSNNQNGNSLSTVNLVRNPEVMAWSGAENLADGSRIATRGVDVNGNLWYQKWERPTNITEEEIAKVVEEASKKREGAVNDIHIDWNNYWVQQVYTGQQTYTDGYGSDIGTGSSHMNQLLAYSDKVKEQTAWYPEEIFELRDKRDYENVYEHVNNFNYGGNSTVYTDDVTGEKFNGTTLMTDMYAENIVNQFGYHNTTDSKNHFEYIILEIDGSYYVCFDFFANGTQEYPANKNMDVERDWVFNDWIVKISPAYLKGQAPEETPDPTPVEPEGSENQQPSVIPPSHQNEVEVNYEIVDSHDYTIADLVTKLSIHVRHATDVEIKIPVPNRYIVESDDLAIFDKHYLDNSLTLSEILEEETIQSVTYDINGYSVTLTVEFVKDLSGEEYIKVSTSGINDEVIKYCFERNGDGINFEIWNYYQTELYDESTSTVSAATDLTREMLKGFLDQSTITFTDEPDYYINAFGWDYVDDTNGQEHYDIENPDDCFVRPASSSYSEPVRTNHLNQTPFNYIYVKNGVTPDEAHQ
ncbi:MAG: hypothetical protein J1D77_02130 [Muribaculaceae bacterium]|nr:hypothetical protein [Muribaculaceae bacterium]